MTRFATFENNERRPGGSQRITGAEVNKTIKESIETICFSIDELFLIQ